MVLAVSSCTSDNSIAGAEYITEKQKKTRRYVGNITVNTDSFKAYMPLTNVTCTGGAGTNVLTFEGTATKDFSNTTWESTGTNNELMKIKPVGNYEVYDPNGAR